MGEGAAVMRDVEEKREVSKEWGVFGRVAGLGVALTYLVLLRASELFADDDGDVHAMYCLRGRDVAFQPGKRKV